ncbi:MAG: Rab family GTPase [Candidatus Thorarchaeota archaeon]
MEEIKKDRIELAFKICVFGDVAVGKTSLVDRYLTNQFHENIQATLGATIHIKFMNLKNGKVTLQIWDFGGQQNFMFLIPSYARGSSGAIFMFDLTNFKSLEKLHNWLVEFKKVSGVIPLILVGNKLDLEQERVCNKEDALKLINLYKFFNYIECSAKTGENIESIFKLLLLEIFRKTGRSNITLI